ncbi:YybH family protein [Kutzneria sp. CA-103260]|uniref:YybH family protein n=1 Tax=Kutzneria sp. CA-103260 TaxID=2802641 RepID=UPI001BAC01AF|nr:nuclear transport factor 2 family protein [Kutzneria sp. CA-103260]QUQ71906.1 ketosteroid isomerase-like protein [Kutzneria sp. CA-103260]
MSPEEIIRDRVRAVAEKDAAALAAPHSADVVLYDVLGPLHAEGRDAEKERVRSWLDGYDGPIDYKIAELTVVTGEDIAFAHYLAHLAGTLRSGGVVDMWTRATVGFQRREGRWEITHEHNSAPLPM